MDQKEKVDDCVLLDAIKTAKSERLLDFIGSVIRLHKKCGYGYTKNESMMSKFRDSFQKRKNELGEQGNA